MKIPAIQYLPEFRNDVFAYNEKKKYHWLQKICLYILKKIGCYWNENKVEVTYIDIEEEKIIDSILKAKHQYQKKLAKEIKYAIIGGKQYSKLKHELHFHISYLINSDTKIIDNIKSIYDIEIIIIPWFDSVLLLPEFKERNICGNANNGMSIQ